MYGRPAPAAPAQTSGYLEVESGSLSGLRVPLPASSGSLLLGREKGCDLTFDHTLEGMVGRRHARIEVRTDGIYLVDLNSVNGTFRRSGPVEGAIRLGSDERFQLGGEDGPWIRICVSEIQHAAPVQPLGAVTTAPASPLLGNLSAETATAPFTAPPQVHSRPVAVPEPAYGTVTYQQPIASGAAWSPAGLPPPRYGNVHPALPRRSDGAGLEVPAAAEPAVRPEPGVLGGLIRHPLLRQALILVLLFCGACVLGIALGLRDVWFVPADGSGDPEARSAE